MTASAKKYIVADYMQQPAITIPTTATLREAVELMIQKKTNGLVVLDGLDRVVGIVSNWDVIQHISPTYDEEKGGPNDEVFVEHIKTVAEDPVTKIMTSRVQTIKPTDSILEANLLLSEFRIRQLPVVDKNDNLVGYINLTDIKNIVGEILSKGG